MQTEIQALQNAADHVGLIVHAQYSEDRRKKQRYFCTLKGTSISPKLDYNDLNHFILGYIKAKQPWRLQYNNNSRSNTPAS